jgi:YlmC/YmxH family sporulation protein
MPVDLEFECKTGRILALIIPGPGKFWGMLGRDCEYVIPWECVVQIGDDIILVEIKEDMCLKKFS